MISFVVSVQGEPPSFKGRSIDAVRVSQAPKIDGKLNDLCWKDAPKTTTFVDPYTENPVEDQTEVFVVYDETSIYIVFYAHDGYPEQILAKETKRDGNPSGDDYVEVALGPFHNHKDRSIFTINAIGTQFSKIAGGRAEKTEWKGDWKGAVSRVEDGFLAEMAIPWSILDYPSTDKPVTIGINFARFHQRTGIKSYWSNIGPMGQNFFEDDGHLQGVLFPPKRERKLKMLSYSFAGTEEEHPRMFASLTDAFGLRLRAGLDIRHQPTSKTNLLLTMNPDFSNVEQEVETIDFSYFARAYSDKRPFFQEGAGTFAMGSDIQPFYSRNISQIDTGLKLYGKVKRTSFGIMDIADLDKWNAVVLSMRQDLWKTSSARAYTVREDKADFYNQLLSLGAQTRWKELSAGANFGGSLTEGEGGKGSTGSINLNLMKKTIWAGGSFFYLSPGYKTSLGFVPYEDLKGWTFGFAYNNERFMGDNYYGLGMFAYDVNRYKGEDYIRYISPWLAFRFRQGASRSYGTLLNFESTKFGQFSDWAAGFKPDISYRFENYSFGFGTNISYGERQGERYTFIKPEVGFSLGKNRLVARYISELLWYKEEGRQHVIWMNFNITPEHSVGSRVVFKKGKWNGYLSYRQTVRRGMDAFFIIGDPNAEEFQKRALLKLLVPLW